MVDTGQTFDPRGADPEVCWRGAADRLLQCCGSAACMPGSSAPARQRSVLV